MPSQTILLPYCAAGVRTDIETLLSRFTETQSVRYEEFAKIWKEMRMPLIYYGRQDVRDMWMFVEELFSIVLNYVMPPYSFQVRVGSLYTMYGLFFKQPNDPKIKFRVTPEKWKTLLEFVEEAQSQSHLDVLYVFLKLRYHRAFHFTVSGGQYDPLLKETTEGEDKNTLADEDTFTHNLLGDLFDSSNVDHLAEVHDQYHRLKCALGGPNASKPDPDTDIIHSNLVHNITKIVAGYEEFKKTGKKPKRKRRDSGGVTTSESEGDSDSEISNVGSRANNQGTIRQQIKSRAFSEAPERKLRRRHQVSSSESSPSPQKKVKKDNAKVVTDDDDEVLSMSSDLRNQLRSAILNMPTSFDEIDTETSVILSPGGSPKKMKKRQRDSIDQVNKSTKKSEKSKAEQQMSKAVVSDAKKDGKRKKNKPVGIANKSSEKNRKKKGRKKSNNCNNNASTSSAHTEENNLNDTGNLDNRSPKTMSGKFSKSIDSTNSLNDSCKTSPKQLEEPESSTKLSVERDTTRTCRRKQISPRKKSK